MGSAGLSRYMEDWSCGAVPRGLRPFWQPRPWHERWWGRCLWPRARSPWHWALLCPDAIQGHQPGSGAPGARQAPEELQVWDLSWLLCSVLICSHPSQHQFSQGTKNCLKTDLKTNKQTNKQKTKEEIPLLSKQAQPMSPTWGLLLPPLSGPTWSTRGVVAEQVAVRAAPSCHPVLSAHASVTGRRWCRAAPATRTRHAQRLLGAVLGACCHRRDSCAYPPAPSATLVAVLALLHRIFEPSFTWLTCLLPSALLGDTVALL